MTTTTTMLRCDRCGYAFQEPDPAAPGKTRVVRLREARMVRVRARAAGWRCKAWTLDDGMADACPGCIHNFRWGREVGSAVLGDRRKNRLRRGLSAAYSVSPPQKG